GERIHINAEIYDLQGFSGHADRDGLLDWLASFEKVPSQIFLVHGEEDAKKDFAELVKNKLGYDCIQVKHVSEFELTKDHQYMIEEAGERIASQESLEKIKAMIASVHENLEHILYNTSLAVRNDVSEEHITQINNIVLDLEKDTVNLGLALTKE
ncbi:MAG: MBL fold metallo-hydrolase RNA specificity domain-containing protein, partial [Eubacteriales bacterium]|nr:MBL fold metallo-hydrolase RNA specificity domain-containing protein [Eubacteriales bacterium]